ncbi:gag-pol polyprotein [Tanacetum coccineum]
MAESAKRHAENLNLSKEIRAATNSAIRIQEASIKVLEIQIGQMSKVLPERGCVGLPSSTKTNPRDHVKSISTTVEAEEFPIRRTLADLGSSVSVMTFSIYTTLGLGYLAPTKLIVELADRTVKRPKGVAKNVVVSIDKFTFPVDFVVLDMLEDIKTPLILGRPFLSTTHAKIDVFKRKIALRVGNDKVVFQIDKPISNIIRRPGRDQVNNLGPTIEECEVIDAPIMEIVKTRNDDDMMTNGIEDYPSFCNYDRKIHDNGAYNLKFSCMIGDVIVGKEFCKEIEVKAKWFEGIITIYNGKDEVTYQIVLSHPRFKHLTNEQCNKIPPLLKVSAQDELEGISHSYQKLKRFYKGVLNLGAEYIKDEEFEEWLTRGHVSVHEMEW